MFDHFDTMNDDCDGLVELPRHIPHSAIVSRRRKNCIDHSQPAVHGRLNIQPAMGIVTVRIRVQLQQM